MPAVHAHDEDDELLELPGGALGAIEELGVEDSGAVTDSEIEDGEEDVGLDAEALGGGTLDEELDLGLDEDNLMDTPTLEDTGDAFDDQLDDADEGERWTDGSEGTTIGFDDEIEDDPLAEDDDGGLEGVDDPLLVALDKDGELPELDGDDDEDEQEDEEELAALILELDLR